jgi:hypothetical protein
VGDGSGNWCGIVLEGGGHYLVRDGGQWPQMSETEQICAVLYLSEVKKHQHLPGPSRDSTR